MSNRVVELESALRKIQSLVDWHCDYEADPADKSPADNVAHVNGLVWQICERAIESAGFVKRDA